MEDQVFLEVLRAGQDDGDTHHTSLSALLAFIENNFERIPKAHVFTVQTLLHRAIELELALANNVATFDVGTTLYKLLQQYNTDEVQLTTVLQILYQVLRTLHDKPTDNAARILGSVTWAKLLIGMLLASALSRTLTANVLACLQLYVQKFADADVMSELWSALATSRVTDLTVAQPVLQALVQLFDEFVVHVPNFEQQPKLSALIQQLLTSELREERKTAYFIMKKRAAAVAKSQHMRQCWGAYISTVENLEENQSHLILPSLESLKHVKFENPQWDDWLAILYHKILSHQNVMVTRWALVYFLESFTCSGLSDDLLLQFFSAANDTSLYNPEGYQLPTANIQQFLKGNHARILGIFTQINWKSVPLHFWLKELNSDRKEYRGLLVKESLLKLATRVRALQNPSIRSKTLELFECIFEFIIDAMPLEEYAMLVETLYNMADAYYNWELFVRKLENAVHHGQVVSISPRLYDILSNSLLDGCFHSVETEDKFPRLLELCKQIPKHKQTWLHFLIIFNYKNAAVVREFCFSHYNIDFNAVTPASLPKFTSDLIAKLAQNKAEETFLREKCVDLFVQQFVHRFDDLATYLLNVNELLNLGSCRTLLKLSELLTMHESKVSSTVLDAILNEQKKYMKREVLCYRVSSNLLKHCKYAQTPDLVMYYANALLEYGLENASICSAVFESGISLERKYYVQGVLLGDAKTGDARTEEIYALKMSPFMPNLHAVRSQYAKSVPDALLIEHLTELVRLNNDISRKKPRYFENSQEHRLKLRIASAVLLAVQRQPDYWSEELLKALLEHNNQLNINYIYEGLTAMCVPNFHVLQSHLRAIGKYSASQQVSLISVTYCYCILHWASLETEVLQEVVNVLLPLTMGANFQTRLYSQLSLYTLFDWIQRTKKNVLEMCNASALSAVISAAIGPQLTDLLHDARISLPKIYLSNCEQFFDIFMHITNAPVDEYNSKLSYSKYEKSRMLFAKKICTVAKSTHLDTEVKTLQLESGNVQRKMNPTSDICTPITLISYADRKRENEMIVVASLIDKIPNLGGIARTCEVLGIKNLVLDSKLHAEKPEFKNLSMTAERGLCIMEVRATALVDFLLQKKLQGFKVVGAEQTANSINFVDFKFPQMCLLLLGHEKEGIPGHLLGFLDYTVEIPQFGMLRSLNVHVTAALFMWEYCKQHIVFKTQ